MSGVTVGFSGESVLANVNRVNGLLSNWVAEKFPECEMTGHNAIREGDWALTGLYIPNSSQEDLEDDFEEDFEEDFVSLYVGQDEDDESVITVTLDYPHYDSGLNDPIVLSNVLDTESTLPDLSVLENAIRVLIERN